MWAKHLIVMGLVATGLITSSGCQAWPGTGLPLNSASRVPPPGTGKYQLPNGYYGNTSALTSNGQVMQAAAQSNLRAPAGALPPTNLASLAAAGSSGSPDNNSVDNSLVNSVESAQFTSPGLNSVQATRTPSAADYVAPASYSLSDAPPTFESGATPPTSLPGTTTGQQNSTASSAPSLQWQQY